jgi:hypothetical protein
MFAALPRREKRRSSGALQRHCAQKIMPLRKAARPRNLWSFSAESLFA